MRHRRNLPPSHETLISYLPEANQILKNKLTAGHMKMIAKRSVNHLDNVFSHVNSLNQTNLIKNPSVASVAHRSLPIGGSSAMGGSASMAGSLHMGGNLADHRDAYHFALDLTPREFEIVREIAVQLLGGKPSPMWGKMTDQEPLEAGVEDYKNIVRMPNQHAAAKMIDAEYGYGKGGGFGKAFKHVARIGAKIAKAGHHVLKFVDRNKDLLMRAIPDEYRGEAEAFLETANRIDDAVNPIVDATIDAVREGATKEDKNKLKRLAEDKIKKVVEDKVPNGKEILKLADDLKQNVIKPVYAQ